MTVIYRCHGIPEALTSMPPTLPKGRARSPGQRELSRGAGRRGGGKGGVAVAAAAPAQGES